MNIFYDLLIELGYAAQDTFTVTYGDRNTINVVAPFVSVDYKSQVYLVVTCVNSQLDEIVTTNYIKAIAQKFRVRPFHTGEMDRNTTLLVLSPHKTSENINTSAKVKIEDDPYYFKKYVLSFDELEKVKAENWLNEELEKSKSIVSSIQEYIGSTTRFDAYKRNHKNEEVYAFLVELVTKVPNFPMRIIDQKEIHSVDYYLKEELDKLRKKRQTPIDVDTKMMERLIDMDIKNTELDSLLSCLKEESVGDE